MDNLDLIPSFLHRVWNTWDANCGPLSEIICFGSPNRLNTFSCKSFAVPSASIVLVHGASTIALVAPWSITTSIVSNSLDRGSPVMKSMERLWKGNVCLVVIG